MLAKSGEDDVCKHCGAVLLCCLTAYRRSQGLQLREPGLGPAASALLGNTRQDPVMAILPIQDQVQGFNHLPIRAPEVGSRVLAPRARSPAKSRATAALSQRIDGPPKPVKASEDVLSPRFKVIDGPAHCSWQSVLALEDEQRSEPGLEPAARAFVVQPCVELATNNGIRVSPIRPNKRLQVDPILTNKGIQVDATIDEDDNIYIYIYIYMKMC